MKKKYILVKNVKSGDNIPHAGDEIMRSDELREGFADDIRRWWLSLILPYYRWKLLKRVNGKTKAIDNSDSFIYKE